MQNPTSNKRKQIILAEETKEETKEEIKEESKEESKKVDQKDILQSRMLQLIKALIK